MKMVLAHTLNENERNFRLFMLNKLSEINLSVSDLMPEFNYLEYKKPDIISKVKLSSLFIVIINRNTKFLNTIFELIDIAIQSNIPTLILIEKNINLIDSDRLEKHIVRFDIKNPTDAIDYITNKITTNVNNQIENKPINPAWIIGGGIALWAFLNALKDSNENQKIKTKRSKRKKELADV